MSSILCRQALDQRLGRQYRTSFELTVLLLNRDLSIDQPDSVKQPRSRTNAFGMWDCAGKALHTISYRRDCMICMTIKVKLLPPIMHLSMHGSKRRSGLIVILYCSSPIRQGTRSSGRGFLVTAARKAYCCQGGSTLFLNHRIVYYSTIRIYMDSLHVGTRSWRLDCGVVEGIDSKAQNSANSREAPR